MKCIAAVVMMALAVVAEAGYVPLAYSAPHTTVVQQNVAPRYVATYAAAPYAATYAAAPVTTYAAAPYAATYAAAPVTTYAAAPVAYSAPVAYTAPHTTVVQNNVAPRFVAPVAYAAAPAVRYSVDSEVVEASPVVAAPVAAPAFVAQPAVAVVAQQEARYTAVNRGAVHDAPLAGHTVSQQSLNLEPAAGTL